jgi:hypothetical protein
MSQESDNHYTLIGKLGLVISAVFGCSGVITIFIYQSTDLFFLGLTFLFLAVVIFFVSGFIINAGYNKQQLKRIGGG